MRVRHLVLLLALALFAGPIYAQGTTGQIAGRIVDAQNLAVPGASVTVTGPQGVKSTSTAGDGRFTVPFLTPGAYSVRAELQGFKVVEQQNINVGLGQTVEVALKMEVGGVTETVQVTGAAKVIDTSSTTIGANLSTADLAQLPIGRRFSDTLYLSAGVGSSGSLGRSNPSISGGTGLENQYVVDGANVTNTGYGGLGSYSIIFGSLGNATPYDFIKEVQVKTGGYEAEFGQSTGGVVNVITKSGSNAFRGSLFGYTQPSGAEGAWTQYQSTNGSVQTKQTSANDVGAEVGGPVFRNHVFFFGAIDPSWQKRTFNAPEGFPLVSLGDVDRDRRTVSYAAKATVQLSSGHRIDASFFGDPAHGDNGPQRISSMLVSSTSSFSTIDYGGHQQAVRYDGVVNSHWLVEAAWARSLNNITELPSVNTWRVTDQTVTPNVITGGIGFYEQGNNSLNYQYSIKSTNIVGGHQIKYGVTFDDVTYANRNQRTGPTFKAPDGRQTATGATISIIPDINFGRIYRVTRANFNSERTTTQQYPVFFLQDSWKVGDRLTVNPGIRYEQEKMSGTLIQDFTMKNNWAPRIGLAYDVTGDGKTKVFGNYGLFYARIPNDLAARALSSDDGFTRGDYFDANLTTVVPNGTATITPTGSVTTNHFVLAGVGADTIDPNAKLSYENELVLGVEREVAPGTTFGIRYIYRNFGRVLEDIANVPMVYYETHNVNVDYILTNPTSATPILADAASLGAKFDDPVHKYSAVEVTLNHRGGNWSSQTSYRWSRLRGNFEGFYRDDNGQSDPGISSLYDFPTNDPSYTAIGGAQYGYPGDIRFLGDANGILPLDRPHQLKLVGNYTFGNGLNLGTNIVLGSGAPMTPLAANPNYTSPGEIPTAARGSGFQTPDGFMDRTPFESQMDLQASWALKASGTRKVTFMADMFNLFNQKRILGYNNYTMTSYPNVNPDFGKPISTSSGNLPNFQSPINVRFGVRFEF